MQTPSPPQLPTVFLHATHDNRLGGHLEHPPSSAQPVWWHPTGREERCRLPTVKASLAPQHGRTGSGIQVLLQLPKQGDVAQAPLRRERQLERGPWHPVESLGGLSIPPRLRGAGCSVG